MLKIIIPLILAAAHNTCIHTHTHTHTHTHECSLLCHSLNYTKMKITLTSHFSKLVENILKYYWLNLFKEIAIGFNHSLQMTRESPASLSDGLSLPSVHLWCCKEFCFSLACYTIIKGPDIKGNAITEFFSKQFYFKQFSLEWLQVLLLRIRVDLGVMSIKEYSAYPKALALLEPHYQIVWCHIQDTHWGSLTPLQRCSRGVFCSLSRLGQKVNRDLSSLVTTLNTMMWTECLVFVSLSLSLSLYIYIYIYIYISQIDGQTLRNVHVGASSMNPNQYSKFLEDCHGSIFLKPLD